MSRLAGWALQREVTRTIIVVLVSLCLLGDMALALTTGDHARDLAKIALRLAELNHRELALERPTTARERHEIDQALASLTRRERERLLRLLLSSVPPRTLTTLIHRASIVAHTPPGARGRAAPLLVPPMALSAPRAGCRCAPRRGDTTRPAPSSTRRRTPPASRPSPSSPPPSPSRPLLPLPALPVPALPPPPIGYRFPAVA